MSRQPMVLEDANYCVIKLQDGRGRPSSTNTEYIINVGISKGIYISEVDVLSI